LTAEQLGEICVKKCRDELQGLREKVISTCKAKTDVMVYQGIAYPGMGPV
jgi:hypothetical protein